ncbi:MAG: alpha-E domain-containing protein [Acidobacteriaceae bacterium]
MLSRVADSLYWMSRYLERAEHTIRLLDINMSLVLDYSTTTAERRWKCLLTAIGTPTEVIWRGDFYQIARTLTFDQTNSRSITSWIRAARENANQVRDEISSEQWQRLNRLYHQVSAPPERNGSEIDLSTFLSGVLDGIHLFQGVSDTTMSHGQGWHFIRIGRYLERATATAALLDAYQKEIFSDVATASDTHQFLEWLGLLRCCAAFEAYTRVNTADLTEERVLAFLLFDSRFPHSLRYCIDSLHEALLAVQQASGRHTAGDLIRTAGRLQASLSFADMDDVLRNGASSYLQEIQRQCREIDILLYHYYIHYSVQAALPA